MVKLIVLAELLAIEFCYPFLCFCGIYGKNIGSYLTYFIHFFFLLNKKPFQDGSEQISHGYFG